jgi:hypothetical protein
MPLLREQLVRKALAALSEIADANGLRDCGSDGLATGSLGYREQFAALDDSARRSRPELDSGFSPSIVARPSGPT